MATGIDPRLVEVHFGDWQGRTFAEIEAEQPGSTKARRRDKWNFRPPGAAGESYAMLKVRAMPWLSEVTRPTVCVTHGGVLRVLVSRRRRLERAQGRRRWPSRRTAS